MMLTEKKMDLFEVDKKYYLAHCISADFELGKGIAVEFKNRFNMKSKLKSNWKGQSPDYPQCILVDKVFNLVTKSVYYGKPTYETLKMALVDMKETCVQENIKFIAMPKIGCGLDKLLWSKVKEIIQEIFGDTDIEILVCGM